MGIRIVSKRTLFKGSVFELLEANVRLPNGTEQVREQIVRPDTVEIIAVREDGRILMTEEWALGAETVVLSLPGGRVEEGMGSLEAQAQRELREETGYRAGQLRRLISLNGDPVNYLSRKVHVFVATDLAYDPLDPDEGELIRVLPLTVEEAASRILHDYRSHPEVIAAVLLYRDGERD